MATIRAKGYKKSRGLTLRVNGVNTLPQEPGSQCHLQLSPRSAIGQVALRPTD